VWRLLHGKEEGTLRMRKVRVLTWMAGLACVSMPGCTPDAHQPKIDAYLLCVECQDAELDSVVVLADEVVDQLGKCLVDGPSEADLRDLREQGKEAHSRILDYVARHPESSPTLIGEDAYVEEAVRSFVATTQKRCAVALGRIGTEAGEDYLREVVRRDSLGLPPDYREDVLGVVDLALPPPGPPSLLGHLTGVVTDSATNAPIARVQVYLERLPRGAVTGSSGRFLISNIASGDYAFMVSCIGYGPVQSRVSVSAPDTASIDILLVRR
jgi:hypothetical protein